MRKSTKIYHFIARFRVLTLLVSLIISGCVTYPHMETGPDLAERQVDVVFESSDKVSVTWGSLFKQATLGSPITKWSPPNIVFAPVTKNGGNDVLGAFALTSGSRGSEVSVFWWTESGKAKEYSYKSQSGSKLSIRWASGRVLRIDDKDISKYVRIRYDDNDPSYDEL